ncbi:Uncharacterised protein [Escherichia coli]|uniref:Uncharacterized protein n=1 Tax=Escherichia coli TaxID=562 RepID=A0A376KTE5_ECOLX|nr:Uncharacterised protein [Escherichia coli]
MRIGEIPTGQATLAQTLHSEQVSAVSKQLRRGELLVVNRTY